MAIHDGHRKRTREEFMARPDSFPDHKLLELLLFYADPRRDTNPTAHTLIDRFGSLAGVLDATPDELRKVPGVGEYTITLLKAVKTAGGRYLIARGDYSNQIVRIEDAEALFQPYFFGARSERVCLLCMDGKGRNLGVRLIGEGTVNVAEIIPRKVVEAALSLNASHIILAHNHVNGLATPSDEDKATTQYLAKLLMAVNVTMVDHLIFCDDDMVSMRQSGFRFLS